jgi:dehydrogenase/reductase SDR family member 12
LVPATREVLARAVDAALEVTIAGSFSRLGYVTRRAVAGWGEPPRIEGRTVIVTGASSGIGRAAAGQLGRLGARVLLVGRDPGRLAAAAEESGGEAFACDLVERDQLDRLVGQFDRLGEIDGVVHCAGALFPERKQAPDGTEMTAATHVLAPFRLTERLRPRLANGVSVIVSSGGMYAEEFDLAGLEMGADGYRGAVAYARAKRAQVALAREWSRRYRLRSCSMHPGWAATPGVETGLPRFARLGPVLRTPAQGADTITWLVAEALGSDLPAEGFYLDRRRRGEYYRPGTRHRPEQERADGEALWEWCLARN